MGPYKPITCNAQLLNYSRLQGYKMIKDESIKFSELITEMQQVRSKWESIGLYLGMKTNQLDSINTMVRKDSKDGLQEVLRQWVYTAQNHEVDLSVLIKACAYPSGGNNQPFANNIAKKYGAYIRIYGTQMYNDIPNKVKINMPGRETRTAESLMPNHASSEEHESTEIQVITLSELVEDLRKIRSKYEEIGVQLQVGFDEMDDIAHTYPDYLDALQAVLYLWISASTNNEVCLSTLIKAIWNPAAGNNLSHCPHTCQKIQTQYKA